MPGSGIDYERLDRRSKRQIVRWVLEASIPRPPGRHHYEITFRTRYPNVRLPEALVERYPDTMKIALRSDYWDLEVYPEHFSVVLLFGGVRTRIEVPLDSIVLFEDEYAGKELLIGEEPVTREPVTEGSSDPTADVVSLAAFRRDKD